MSSPKRINNQVIASRIYNNNNTKMTSISRLNNYGRTLSNKNRYEILFFNKKDVYNLMNVLNKKKKDIENKVRTTIDTTQKNITEENILADKGKTQSIVNIVKNVIPSNENKNINFKKFNNDLYLNNITLLERISSFRIYSYYEGTTIDFTKLDYKIINENNNYKNYIRFKYIIDFIKKYPPEVEEKLKEISQKINPQSINKIEDLIKYSNIKNKSNNINLMKSILEEINSKNDYIDYFIILDIKKNWLRRINKINKIGNSNTLTGGACVWGANICGALIIGFMIFIFILITTILIMNKISDRIDDSKNNNKK